MMVLPHDSLLSYGSCCLPSPIPLWALFPLFGSFDGFVLDPFRLFFEFHFVFVLFFALDPLESSLLFFQLLTCWFHA